MKQVLRLRTLPERLHTRCQIIISCSIKNSKFLEANTVQQRAGGHDVDCHPFTTRFACSRRKTHRSLDTLLHQLFSAERNQAMKTFWERVYMQTFWERPEPQNLFHYSSWPLPNVGVLLLTAMSIGA